MKEKKTLRSLRRELDLSQKELAEKAGTTDKSISLYENDINALRAASFETIEAIAHVLGVTVSDIFLGDTSIK